MVVTGLGLISPCGNDVQSAWEAVLARRSGIDRIGAFDVGEYTSQIGGEIKDFDPTTVIDKKEARRMDRFTQLAIAASVEAMNSAGLGEGVEDSDRFGTIIGSGIGGIYTFETQHENLIAKGPSRISPFFIPMMISDMAAGLVSVRFGLKGPNFCTVSACASGGHAIATACLTIKHGLADAVLTGGAEATISPMALGGFCSMKALSTRNDEPQRASRPFDRDRDGFIMAEGSGMVVIEELEHARARGATILAELVGMGMTGDAYHMTSPAPEGEGQGRAMRMALDDAGIEPKDVDYINAHGTSTQLNDPGEAAAIRRVFGEGPDAPKVSSTKSSHGHLLGAAAGHELVLCVRAIGENMLPPTANLENVDPSCELNHVFEAEEAELTYVMSNSFGFGGHNVSLLLRRYEE